MVTGRTMGLAGSVAIVVTGSACGDDILWDNNDPSGNCSYSQLTDPRRSTLDDFLVDGDGWIISRLETNQQWNTLPPGSGTGYELVLYENVLDPGFGESEGPGKPLFPLDVTDYEEIGTGRTFFSRPEFIALVEFEPVFLPPGRYWMDMHVLGPENCWMLCAGPPQRDNMGWVNYEDLGGLRPTRLLFGAPRNGSYRLYGVVVDCPADLDDDGEVGFGDVLMLLAAWGPCSHQSDCPEDFDDDGLVGVSDLLVVLAAWGRCR